MALKCAPQQVMTLGLYETANCTDGRILFTGDAVPVDKRCGRHAYVLKNNVVEVYNSSCGDLVDTISFQLPLPTVSGSSFGNGVNSTALSCIEGKFKRKSIQIGCLSNNADGNRGLIAVTVLAFALQIISIGLV